MYTWNAEIPRLGTWKIQYFSKNKQDPENSYISGKKVFKYEANTHTMVLFDWFTQFLS